MAYSTGHTAPEGIFSYVFARASVFLFVSVLYVLQLGGGVSWDVWLPWHCCHIYLCQAFHLSSQHLYMYMYLYLYLYLYLYFAFVSVLYSPKARRGCIMRCLITLADAVTPRTTPGAFHLHLHCVFVHSFDFCISGFLYLYFWFLYFCISDFCISNISDFCISVFLYFWFLVCLFLNIWPDKQKYMSNISGQISTRIWSWKRGISEGRE